MTHPFSPHYKKTYAIKSSIHRGPKPYLICITEDGEEALLPVEHTSLGKPRLSEDEQDGVPYFTYGDLLELKRIIESLESIDGVSS